jgi:hypothetical protein
VYVYIESQKGVFTVGFYDPQKKFRPDSDHETAESAAARVHYLNGGTTDAKLSHVAPSVPPRKKPPGGGLEY